VFLKTLQIKGFKSFADVATLELEPGVTVVVGPNGSGKSNVVDAIGWVLGAQAPSAVRSQKMDDVIFAGSAKRPALGRAEVALTIDNSAGLLPIDFSEVTISRVLFRSGDSEYSINGVPCRLLDIQELLSDSGVGRQQHVIISQGQIDAVLNARPEDRRLIIEEAAGILKFRRRKEKAERRLTATEANLTRIQDLLREVRRQLKPLERQADAARRHHDVAGELQALRVHLAGRDLARLRTQLQASTAQQTELRTTDRTLRSQLAALDAEVLEVEAHLSGIGGPDVSDVLVRYESFRERARGLTALVAERRRGVDRDREAFVDQAVVASLESERADCERELADVEAAQADQDAERAELTRAEAELVAAQERHEAEWSGEAQTASAGEIAAARAELAAMESAAQRLAGDRDRLAARHRSLSERLEARRAECAAQHAEIDRREAVNDPLRAKAGAASAALSTALEDLTEATTAAESATEESHRWSARVDALTMALDEARQQAGAERVADVDGVVGTLLDAIEIDPGWEAAVEAAASHALGLILVDGVVSGRNALTALAAAQVGGAVLPLGATGSVMQEATHVSLSGSQNSEAIRPHVRSTRPGVAQLLDSLLGTAVCVDGGWETALDHSLTHPELTVVTRDGDRFSPQGWALQLAGSGATGAALEEATGRATDAAAALATATAYREACDATVESARAVRAAAGKEADANAVALESAVSALARAERDTGELEVELSAVDAERVELDDRHGQSAGRVAELAASMPALELAESDRARRDEAAAEARRGLAEHQRRVAGLRSEIGARVAALGERHASLTGRLEHLETRLLRHQADRLVAQRRHRELDARAHVLDVLATFVAGRSERIDGVLDQLRAARHEQSERTRSITTRLDSLRRDRSEREKALDVVRERLQRAEVADAETKLRLETTTEALRGELDVEPHVAMATECPPLAEGTSAPARVRELERDLRLMGPINPLALEEFQALQERNTFYEGQLDDIRQTRRELGKVIRAVDEEITTVFSAAFADVSENFVALFDTLFPGGNGRLRLTEPHDLLNTGIELEARPSGKNVKKLSLLSGGERSLTALAYLFAVFRSRPSPFYVMDEVEAALDDVNLHRFLGLVAEFRDAAQLIIVSHQKRTMEAADVLYGVTMEPGGSSKVLSERVGALLD
jgi:chromosome segregation protein